MKTSKEGYLASVSLGAGEKIRFHDIFLVILDVRKLSDKVNQRIIHTITSSKIVKEVPRNASTDSGTAKENF